MWILVWRVRQKIELDPKHPELLVSVPGAGYRLVVDGRAHPHRTDRPDRSGPPRPCERRTGARHRTGTNRPLTKGLRASLRCNGRCKAAPGTFQTASTATEETGLEGSSSTSRSRPVAGRVRPGHPDLLHAAHRRDRVLAGPQRRARGQLREPRRVPDRVRGRQHRRRRLRRPADGPGPDRRAGERRQDHRRHDLPGQHGRPGGPGRLRPNRTSTRRGGSMVCAAAGRPDVDGRLPPRRQRGLSGDDPLQQPRRLRRRADPRPHRRRASATRTRGHTPAEEPRSG